jgi:hypothetical protein
MREAVDGDCREVVEVDGRFPCDRRVNVVVQTRIYQSCRGVRLARQRFVNDVLHRLVDRIATQGLEALRSVCGEDGTACVLSEEWEQ